MISSFLNHAEHVLWGEKMDIKNITLFIKTHERNWQRCHWGKVQFQFSSVAQSCPTLCNPMNLSTPDLPVHHQLPEFTQTHIHWVNDAIQPFHLQLSPPPFLQSFPTSGSFSNESTLRIRWPNIGFSFNITLSREYSGLISSRMDCLNLLTVKRTLKSLL